MAVPAALHEKHRDKLKHAPFRQEAAKTRDRSEHE